MVFAGPRVYYAMPRDGLFLPGAARVHPSWRTPAAAIVAQGFWASLLVISGTFDHLALYTGFAVVLFATVAVTALSCCAGATRTSRGRSAWGYPLAPSLFVIIGWASVFNAIWREPGPSGADLLIIGLGIPLYYLVKGRFAKASAPARASSRS